MLFMIQTFMSGRIEESLIDALADREVAMERISLSKFIGLFDHGCPPYSLGVRNKCNYKDSFDRLAVLNAYALLVIQGSMTVPYPWVRWYQ